VITTEFLKGLRILLSNSEARDPALVASDLFNVANTKTGSVLERSNKATRFVE